MITTLRYTFHLFETTITHYTYGFITFPQNPLDCTEWKMSVCTFSSLMISFALFSDFQTLSFFFRDRSVSKLFFFKEQAMYFCFVLFLLNECVLFRFGVPMLLGSVGLEVRWLLRIEKLFKLNLEEKGKKQS